MISNEPEHLVRRSVAEVVSSIAKLALPAQQWPDLLDYMLQLSQSQHAEHREVSMVVFMSLTDALGDQMRPQFVQLQRIFSAGLTDPSPPVRLAALRVSFSPIFYNTAPPSFRLYFIPILFDTLRTLPLAHEYLHACMHAYTLAFACVSTTISFLPSSLPLSSLFEWLCKCCDHQYSTYLRCSSKDGSQM